MSYRTVLTFELVSMKQLGSFKEAILVKFDQFLSTILNHELIKKEIRSDIDLNLIQKTFTTYENDKMYPLLSELPLCDLNCYYQSGLFLKGDVYEGEKLMKVLHNIFPFFIDDGLVLGGISWSSEVKFEYYRNTEYFIRFNNHELLTPDEYRIQEEIAKNDINQLKPSYLPNNNGFIVTGHAY